MASLLEGTIANIIGSAFSGIFYDCTVTRTTVAGGDADEPSTGTPTTTNYSCKGIVDTYSNFELQNSLIRADDRKILILATSLDITPDLGDTITIQGNTYEIIRVDTDPATAVWTIQARQ